jgi:hypothetical protein
VANCERNGHGSGSPDGQEQPTTASPPPQAAVDELSQPVSPVADDDNALEHIERILIRVPKSGQIRAEFWECLGSQKLVWFPDRLNPKKNTGLATLSSGYLNQQPELGPDQVRSLGVNATL